jgi:hypothetical protein
LNDPQQINPFSYVAGNPIRHSDPSGHALACSEGPATCGSHSIETVWDFYASSNDPNRRLFAEANTLIYQAKNTARSDPNFPGMLANAQQQFQYAASFLPQSDFDWAEAIDPVGIGLAAAAAVDTGNDFVSGGGGAIPEIYVSSDEYPETAQHIQDAQDAGYPSVLTIDRGGAADRRKESLAGYPTRPGFDRDEYPPAMFLEGGEGASVRYVPRRDNRGAGACIGNACLHYSDGTQVRIIPR